MNFQMCNTHASIIDNVISISLKVRDEEFKYAETFEWEITCANMPKLMINNKIKEFI